MGKHNGKARRTGLPVGKTLENATKQSRGQQFGASSEALRVQSVLKPANVDDVITLAELAGREFAAEKQKVVHVDSHLAGVSHELDPQESALLYEKYKHVVKIPRRPSWSSDLTPEALDRQEKQSFLNWRRDLAQMQEKESAIMLTPYEKNLEVWRQLWRVLERSDILVQVVDARNPLLYYSEDLTNYAREIDPCSESLILANKADLVDARTRQLWAEYFTRNGLRCFFWSAKRARDEETVSLSEEEVSMSVRVHGVEEVVALLESLAARKQEWKRRNEEDSKGRCVIGLVGYPNVGKSSTINALFGRKKTPVAATPGKTKHFQTLNIGDTLCLCDCPGLVLPAFAKSKAEMVAGGVIPVDRLVDVVAPVELILSKIGLRQFCRAYNLPRWKEKQDSKDGSLAVEGMAALAISRGWMQSAGRPDQTKTGRCIIKDFLTGKLLFTEVPPGCDHLSETDSEDSAQQEEDREADEVVVVVDNDDALLRECIVEEESAANPKLRRAAHKFHKKPPRRKGNRGRQYNQDQPIASSVNIKGHRGSLVNGMLNSHP